MTLIDEPLPGVKILRPFVFEDSRGNFVKPFHEGQLADHRIVMTVREEFFSTSAVGVLRGMHFQVPPHAHQKLVYCLTGRVLDVVLDLRRGSLTFGRAAGFELSAANRHVLHIPIGFAHGFLSLDPASCLVYKTDAVHNPDCDRGIRWDSFGFDWTRQQSSQAVTPTISNRDAEHPSFAEFTSPFEDLGTANE